MVQTQLLHGHFPTRIIPATPVQQGLTTDSIAIIFTVDNDTTTVNTPAFGQEADCA